MITLTNQEVLAATQQLTRLSQYAFGSKVRYGIDYNLDKLEGPARRIQKERQKILETYGTPEETRAEVSSLLEHIGESGGFIASPAHSIPADAKLENIAAMIDVFVNQ